MASERWLWVTVGATAFVYFVIGVLLLVRRHKRSISSRSPLMLLISHCANLADLLFLYQAAWQYQTHTSAFSVYYTPATVFCHYLYYFPYLLRCYRLKFVFTVDSSWENTAIQYNIHQSRQRWLLLILAVLMVPVGVLAVCAAIYHKEVAIVPESTQQETVRMQTEALYILVCFVEEVLFVVAVFQLRHIRDDFKMTVELTAICALWFCNTIFSKYTDEIWWVYECAVRNWLIMLISSIWPAVKSFQRSEFLEAITPQVASSLELVLRNEFTLECFERFLEHESSSSPKSPGHSPTQLLRFWLESEIYASDPSREHGESLLAQSRTISTSLHSDLEVAILANDPKGEVFMKARAEVFAKLKELFAAFQQSAEYSRMMREVLRQEIYVNRLMAASMHGEEK